VVRLSRIQIIKPVFLFAVLLAASSCGGSSPAPTPSPPSQVLKIACPAPMSLVSPTGLPTPVHYGTATATGGSSPVISCTPANDSTFPIGSTTVICTATDSKNATDSCSFGVTLTTPPRVSLTTFLAFGDSMTAGEITDPNALGAAIGKRIVVPTKAYPADLQVELAARYTAQTIAVTNAGKSGEAADDPATLGRLNSYLNGPYQALLLMEGANDINSRDNATVPLTIAAIDQMIRAAKGRGLRVLLATLPPQNPAGSLGNGAILVPTYNDALRNLAAAENVALVDVYQAFGGDVTTLIGSDGLHPTVAGYQRIADTFFTAIKQSLELPSTATSTALSAPFVAGVKKR
jgi:lysophospholipase L1-like esterase